MVGKMCGRTALLLPGSHDRLYLIGFIFRESQENNGCLS